MYALALKSDIITVPAKILQQWAVAGLPIPSADFQYGAGNLAPIPYEELDITTPDWARHQIGNELTEVGIDKFSADWNALIK